MGPFWVQDPNYTNCMLMKLVLLEILVSRKKRTSPENTQLDIYGKKVVRSFRITPVLSRTKDNCWDGASWWLGMGTLQGFRGSQSSFLNLVSMVLIYSSLYSNSGYTTSGSKTPNFMSGFGDLASWASSPAIVERSQTAWVPTGAPTCRGRHGYLKGSKLSSSHLCRLYKQTAPAEFWKCIPWPTGRPRAANVLEYANSSNKST